MFLLHRIADHERCRRETHIHPEGGDAHANEQLGPVDLEDGQSGDQDGTGQKGAHGDDHDPGRAELAEHDARGDGGDGAGDDERTEVGGGQQW